MLQLSIISALVASTMKKIQEDLLYKEECFQIIGVCMEVHNNLGAGFSEVVYKDAIEYELKSLGIWYERSRVYEVHYKDTILPHQFYADFVVFDKVILEVKGIKEIRDEHIAQAINFLKVSRNKLALIVNFGDLKLNFKRLIV